MHQSSAVQPFPPHSDIWHIEQTQDKGRRFVASADVQPGTTLFEEQAFAWQPLDDFRFAMCHHCMKEFEWEGQGIYCDGGATCMY